MASLVVAAPLPRQLSSRNPNPTPNNTFRRVGIYGAPSRLSCSSIPRTATVLTMQSLDPKRCIGSRFLSVDRRVLALLPLAVSKDDGSRHSDDKVGKHKDELVIVVTESQKSRKKMHKCFKEGAIPRFFGDSTMGKVIGEFMRVFIAFTPFMKDVEEILFLSDTLKELSEVKDFFLGICYALFIGYRGMITEADPSFFYILFTGLFYLSISSFRAWKAGQSSEIYLSWQSVLVGHALTKEWRMISQNCSFAHNLLAIVSLLCSVAILAFYAYRVIVESRCKGPSYQELVARLEEEDVMEIDDE